MTERSTIESAEFDRLMEAYFEKHLPLPLRRPWVESALRKLMAVDELRAGLDGMTGLTGFEAVDAIIERAGLSVSYENCEHIPPRGRLMAVASPSPVRLRRSGPVLPAGVTWRACRPRPEISYIRTPPPPNMLHQRPCTDDARILAFSALCRLSLGE